MSRVAVKALPQGLNHAFLWIENGAGAGNVSRGFVLHGFQSGLHWLASLREYCLVRDRITACDDPAPITISASPGRTGVSIGIDQVNLRACHQSAWFTLECSARTRPWTVHQLSETATTAKQAATTSLSGPGNFAGSVDGCFCERRNQSTVRRTGPYGIPARSRSRCGQRGGESSRGAGEGKATLK